MNARYLGDSYDLVKRFFCQELRALGYHVTADPMFTGAWDEERLQFFRLIGVDPAGNAAVRAGRTALFLDPDTGVNHKGGKQHVSFDRLALEATRYTVVFSFDQSFSRQASPLELMRGKLSALKKRGCHALYYDSHARFLFAASREETLVELERHLVALGLPTSRLLGTGT
jgi:hypothetical protein